MKRVSKAIALLICLILVVGMLPAGVFAADGGLSDIDFTKEADAGKYEISGQSQSAVVEGTGLALIATQGGVEPAKQNIAEADNDVVKVPVAGDWSATLEVEFDSNGAANGYYQFFAFFASEGGDNQNMCGIRGGDGAMQNFIRQDGTITHEDEDGVNSTPGFASAGTYFLRLEKEGDTYICSRSSDGDEFTQMFTYEGTGIEADEILIDAYTGMTANYKFTLKYLALEGGETGLDKKAIRAAIREAKTKDERFFTEETFAVLKAALEAAQTALAEATTQEALDKAAADLTAAIEGLEDNPELPMMRVTFNYNYNGAPDPVVVEVKMGSTVEPIEAKRIGYSGTWRYNNQNFNFSTPITDDITLTASWTKDWNQMYSLAEEYRDYFAFGNFGTQSPNGDQVTREYNTFSGNSGKMTYNFGANESRNAYDSAVSEINARTDITDAEKAELIKEADGKVLLGGNNPLQGDLNRIQQWNQQHPEGPKKYYRQHVLFWHGSEQNPAFYHEGFDTSKPLASKEVMNLRIDSYVEAMFKRYQPWDDIILSWDVVNEALDDYTGMVRNGWNGSSWGETGNDDASSQSSAWGTIYRMKDANGNPVKEMTEERLQYEAEWIREAFKAARKWQKELGVHWKLYYNDYMNSSMLYEPKMTNTLKVLEPIGEAGDIDGYGMQARLAYAYPTIDMLRDQIEKGVEICGEVSFSEADVRTDFEVNPLYDPNKETRRVRSGDEEWDQGGSGSYNRRSQQNGNTYDVSNGPVRRKNNFSASDPEAQRLQADYWADLVDIMLEKAELGKVGAIAIDGTSDNNTFNSGTGCQIWDGSGNEKPAFFALIGAPNRLKMRHAIEDGPAATEEAKYTAASWARYAAAKKAAEDLVEVRIYTANGVEAVKDATAELLAATEALVKSGEEPEVDKTALGEAIEAAEALKAEDYTEDSYKALTDAVEAAKAIQSKADATQAEVDAAAKAVTDAVAALEPAPGIEKPDLDKVLAEAEAIDKDKYTEDSVKALEEAVEAAKAVKDKADATQDEIDAAAKAVEDAIAALVEKEPAEEPFLFDDVKNEKSFYFNPVYWAFEAKPQITNGVDKTHFGPDQGCTRGQVVTFLWRAAGEPAPANAETAFTDVGPKAFYAKAVAWAVEKGITKGMTDTTFAPNDTCTRGQIVTFLYRFKDSPAPKSTETAFTDVSPKAFYAKAVAWAVENGVTKGMTDTTFAPNDTCTRGQVVTFLFRATAE